MSVLRFRLPKKVTTLEQALEILSDDSWGRTRSWGIIDVSKQIIIRKSYTEGSSGADHSEYDELPIDKSIINTLKSGNYVQGTPQWGFTDNNILKINEFGEREATAIRKRKTT